MAVVLDACAMIAYLRDEDGADIVDNFLQGDEACLAHALNLCEVFYDFMRVAGEETALAAIEDLKNAGVIVREDMDRVLWQEAGRIKAKNRVSLADCFAIALANREVAALISFDHHELDVIAATGICKVTFIR